jgi:predicted nucleic acid-binding Zn ribbon protein
MKCEVCGKEIDKSLFTGNTLCSHECFKEIFWREIVANKESYIIANNNCYQIGNEQPMGGDRGFGGKQFFIELLDGKHFITTNLWHQGSVPEKFMAALPNNAVLL